MNRTGEPQEMAATEPRPLPERRACSIEEAAAMLGMPRSSAYLLASNGEFPAKTIKVGRRYYVVIASLDELLAA